MSGEPVNFPQSRIRRKGAGRKRTVDKDPWPPCGLDRLVDPATGGDPESPLRWTCKSVRALLRNWAPGGHAVSHQTVAELLHEMDYSLQANQKKLEGSQHADRNQQFEYINRKAQRYLKQGEPVISVDTKKEGTGGRFPRIRGANGNRRASPSRFGFTTSKSVGRRTVRWLPMGPMTWAGTRGGSAWE